jgi:L-lactate dehydrogenase
MTDTRRPKLTIVGAGSVGATTAYACLTRGVAGTLAIFDIAEQKVRAEVLDLNHGAAFVPVCDVIGSSDIEVTDGSDIIVITAGAKQKPGQTRLDLAEANVNIMRNLVPRLVERSPDAIVIPVTNPCDVVTYAAQKFSGLPRERVFGSGTVLDSARLRYLLADYIRVSPSNVHAYIAGEHGDSEITLWSSATVGAVPLKDWAPPGREPLDAEARRQIHEQVVNAAYEIIQGKGATWYAIGLAVARICEAVFRDEDRVLPVSSYLEDYFGISDVCLSVPSIVDRRGVVQTMKVPMSDSELEGLRKSADEVRAVCKSLGL